MKTVIWCVFYLLIIINVNAKNRGLDTILYDNGPVITSSDSGVGGADESVLENNTLSMTSFGTAHSSNLNLRVSDEFTVTDSSWQINSIDFYAYQTGETASTITGINLRIWNGVPGATGSSVVFGDTTTNILANTINSGIIRVDENTQGIVNDRQIALSSVEVDIELSSGTYWLDWQSNGSGNAGPFVPHITIPGQNTTGNALLSTDNGTTYTQLTDNGSLTGQGLPFMINGSIVSGPQPAVQSVPSLDLLSLTLLVFLLLIVVYFRNNLSNHN